MRNWHHSMTICPKREVSVKWFSMSQLELYK